MQRAAVLLQNLASPYFDERVFASQALASTLPMRDEIAMALTIALGDPEPKVQRGAADSLSKAGVGALNALIGSIPLRNNDVRQKITELLKNIGATAVRATLGRS